MNEKNGIQETVRLGLINLAGKVDEGRYGENDDAFNDDSSQAAFLSDLEDEVINKME